MQVAATAPISSSSPGDTTARLLRARSLLLRVDSLRATTEAGAGHPTSCLSSADIVASLFFSEFTADLANPTDLSNDRFILSKGHAAPLLYSVYKQLGEVSDEQLLGLRKFTSSLEGHPTPEFRYTVAATGSLGQGLSVGLGLALALKMSKVTSPKIWVLLGDGELAEGSVWEAVALAKHYRLDNLCAIVDVNRLGQSGPTMLGHDIFAISDRFAAFGWCPVVVDGLDIKQVLCGLCKARRGDTCGGLKPTALICRTVKGAPLAEVCDKLGFHGKPFSKDKLPAMLSELRNRYAEASAVTLAPVFKLPLPHPRIPYPTHDVIEIPSPTFAEKGTRPVSVRRAYAEGVAAVARACSLVVGLDGDVKNSTFFELLEDVNGGKLIQCFIAEQNMVGVAVGLHAAGRIPFVSTFGCFFTRAFDQLRMAALSRASLRCSGTHCGISTGSDGPSQMGLEDIALFRTLPGSVVLCPADGVAAYRMAELVANFEAGISYVRLPRPDVITIYDADEHFVIGGSKVLREASQHERCCIVAAGMTVHEALKAADQLRADDNIQTSVIDAYSIKPLDAATLHRKSAASRVICVVEDHYEGGGLGDAVCAEAASWLEPPRVIKLCVRQVPRSGAPEELRAWAKIDAASIVSIVRNLPSSSNVMEM